MTAFTRTSINKIVVGIDGYVDSRRAFQWATELAAAEQAQVVAVMAWAYPPGLMLPTLVAPSIPAGLLADGAARRLRAFVNAYTTNPDVVVKRETVMGSPRTALTELSEDADLLVVGRTGSNRVTRALAGSTASSCARNAACPVVIVGDQVKPAKTITVAVDGSDSSIDALVWALGRGPDHDIVAVYSHDEWELDELPLDDDFRRGLSDEAAKMLEAAVAKAVERTGDDDDRVIRQIRQGDPRTTIVEQGDPSELLVLGAHGHSGLTRWVLGSLADYAVHHAPGTVVICR